LALLDRCARHSDTEGRAPALPYTRDIAEQVAALYWPQVIPYRLAGTGTAVELRQITLLRAAQSVRASPTPLAVNFLYVFQGGPPGQVDNVDAAYALAQATGLLTLNTR